MLVVAVYIKEAGKRVYGITFLVRVTGIRFVIGISNSLKTSKYHVPILRGSYLDRNQPHYNHFLLPAV